MAFIPFLERMCFFSLLLFYFMGCSSSKDENETGKQVFQGEAEGEIDEATASASAEPKEVLDESPQEPEMKKAPPVIRPRDPKHIFEVTLKKRPLGIVLTSEPDGQAAYVTSTDGKKSKAVKGKKLPLNSKLLKVNGVHVENEQIISITDSIRQGAKDLPLVLTFCHPDGLDEDEHADPDPKDDFTKR